MTKQILWPATALLAGACALIGCNDKPSAPPPDDASATRPAYGAASAPDFSKRATLALNYLPLSVQAPPSWAVKPVGGVIFLQGPVPVAGITDVSIQLARLPTVAAKDLASFIKGAQLQTQRDPDHMRLDGPRIVGKLTILQQQTAPRTPAPSTRPVSSTLPSAGAGLFHWTVWVFVENRTHDYQSYTLNFVALDVDTYNANKDFLQSIVDSIVYDPRSELDIR